MRYRSAWLAAAWFLVALVIALGVVPSAPEGLFVFGDKALHFIQFLVVMVWFGGIYSGRAQWIVAASLAALGLAIEVAQGLSVFRTFDLGDVVANLAGLAAGLLLVRTALRDWCRRVETTLA